MKTITAALILLLVVLQYEFWFAEGGVFSILKLKEQISQQIELNLKLKDRNQALKVDIHDLKNGHQAIEERARSELGMIKEGEVFYQVIRH